MGYVEPPLMSLAPQFGEQPGYSHELDSSAKVNSPQISAYQSQSENVTPRRMPSPPSADIAAPQPRSPPPTLTSSRFQYQYPRHPAVSPPIAAHRTPGSNHDSSSYGFPSHEATPNQDVEGFQFQQPHHQGAGSPESQQRLVPRRAVGTPNLRRTN